MIPIFDIIGSFLASFSLLAIELPTSDMFADGNISLYATLGIVITLIVVGIVLAFIIYPRYVRKKALKIKTGEGSAMPTAHMNPKTNPWYTREDSYVDSSEPNPFLKK